jgi:hypothetical protein
MKFGSHPSEAWSLSLSPSVSSYPSRLERLLRPLGLAALETLGQQVGELELRRNLTKLYSRMMTRIIIMAYSHVISKPSYYYDAIIRYYISV